MLDLIARGRTNGEIAEELGISFATAKWHVSELISKLGVASREDVARYWREHGSVRGRFERALRALSGPLALKLAAGGAALVLTAGGAGVIAMAIANGRNDSAPGETLNVIAREPTPTSTPVPEQNSRRPVAINERPPECPQFGTTSSAGMLCSYRHFPDIAELDKGNCDLSGADFEPIFVSQVDFRGCNLAGANLKGAAQNGSDFSHANLTGATLTGGSFAEADFSYSDLSGARANPAILNSAKFAHANLTGADIGGAILNGAFWLDTTCPDGTNSDANGGTCVGTRGVENPPTTFSTAPTPTPAAAGSCPQGLVSGQLYAGPRCARSQFPVLLAATRRECDLSGADLHGQQLDYVDLRGCVLINANLAGASLLGASLAGADLAGANLGDSRMWAVDLTGARLTGASLRGAFLKDAKLLRADLTGADLSGALLDVFWANTTCPDGTNSDVDDGDRATCLNNR